VNAPVRSVGLDEKRSWLKDFWKNIEKHSGGSGGDGGGGGGGGGCQ
jgi:hypothetical protein